MPQSVDQFAKSLVAAGLSTADEIKTFWGALPAGERPKDGETFSQLLVRFGKLTEFQAQELLSGARTPLVLGDYVLLDKIGAGGMGQVFKAQHRVMERLVAIKLLPPNLVKDEDAVKRFQREVVAAAKLSHPHIVAALDARRERGVWCLVMEYVEGSDLACVVAREGPLPVARAVEYVRQAARGLAYAHENGVVHRDIKPANLLLDRKGVVKILDMGLARLDDAALTAAHDGLTTSGQVMGTIDYMAPEQAFSTKTADARADIYSLGCTLWRLLTGKNLFDGETVVQKLMAHQTLPIPSLASERADVSPLLQQIMERMVAKQPDDRFQTMAELEAALIRLDGSLPSGAAQFRSDAKSRWNANMPVRLGTQPEFAPTVALAQSQVKTDPVSVRTISLARQAASPRTSGGPQSRLPWYLGGGLAGIFFVFLGVWAVVAGKPGGQISPSAGSTNSRDRTATSGGPSDPRESIAVNPAQPPPPLAIAPFRAADARQHQQAWAQYLGLPVEKEISLPAGGKLVMVLIPPGEFLRNEQNQPFFRVRLTQPFYLGKHEVTQAQWQAVTRSNPSRLNDANHPVEMISWEDIGPFLAQLNAHSAKENLVFSLPTDAQWECACRAGTLTSYAFGESPQNLGDFAWFKDNSGGKTHPVGKLNPNAFGLYDMHGNVWELCSDWSEEGYFAKAPTHDPTGPAQGTRRVNRGGGWADASVNCRSSTRGASDTSHRGPRDGFRLAAAIELEGVGSRGVNAGAPSPPPRID